jgi:hypothetical protein
VSVFRPNRTVGDPRGQEWEIYAYRLKLAERHPPDPGLDDLGGISYLSILTAPLDAVVWLLGHIPWLLVLVFFDFPVAAVRALGSDEWTIEAVTWVPHRQSYTWTTTREHRGQVLAQVEAGIAQGDIPRPRNARFVGVRL